MAGIAIAIVLLAGSVGLGAYSMLRRRFQRTGHRHPSLVAGICVLVALDTVAGWVISGQRHEADPPPSAPVVVVLAISLLGTLGFYGYCVAQSYKLLRNSLRRKGYKSPAVFTTVEMMCLVFILAGWVVCTRYLREPLPAAAALVIVAPLIGTAITSLLHPGDRRTAGPRFVRFPYKKAGYVLIGLGVATPFAFWLAGSIKTAIPTCSLLFSAAGASFAIAKRALAPPATSVMTEDHRRPVLFLRPFSQEEQVFAETTGRSRYFGWIRIFAKQQTRTLEQYLGEEIRLSIGPFVALGNPEDFVAPLGAARFYVDDARWKEEFCDIAHRAALILMVVGVSEHVIWELRYLREAGLARKLFVLTKTHLRKRWGVRKKEAVQRHAEWTEFSAALQREGYQPDERDPGPGSVISFDTEGRMVLLGMNAKSPAEALRPIIEKLGVSDGGA